MREDSALRPIAESPPAESIVLQVLPDSGITSSNELGKLIHRQNGIAPAVASQGHEGLARLQDSQFGNAQIIGRSHEPCPFAVLFQAGN